MRVILQQTKASSLGYRLLLVDLRSSTIKAPEDYAVELRKNGKLLSVDYFKSEQQAGLFFYDTLKSFSKVG